MGDISRVAYVKNNEMEEGSTVKKTPGGDRENKVSHLGNWGADPNRCNDPMREKKSLENTDKGIIREENEM